MRAVAAWGCAIDAGKTREYHDIVYANQPQEEGTGWTNEQLIGFADQAGLTGAAKDAFTTCVNDGTYRVWSANSYQSFITSGVQGTPYADGLKKFEELVQRLARDHGLPVFGSFNPHTLGCTSDM